VAATPTVDYSGNRVEQAPRDLASATVTYSPRVLHGGRLSVEYSHTGRYATDAANTHSYGGYYLVNLNGSYSVTRQTELFAHVTNVMDRTYGELVSYDPFQGSQFNPGSPRSVYLGVHYTWER
jgi:outer membrane receptor protein involved in Fe transport